MSSIVYGGWKQKQESTPIRIYWPLGLVATCQNSSPYFFGLFVTSCAQYWSLEQWYITKVVFDWTFSYHIIEFYSLVGWSIFAILS